MPGSRAPKSSLSDSPPSAAPEAAEAGRPSELEAIAEASTARHAAVLAPAPAVPPALAPGDGGPAMFGLMLGRLAGEGDTFEIETAGGRFPARLDPSLHPAVAKTARSRSEPVLITRDPDGSLIVVGALRTSPTPGVDDDIEEISLKAKRIHIEATEEAQIRSGAALIAVRAVGEVETYADRIMSRAEEVQKIVARMLRLN